MIRPRTLASTLIPLALLATPAAALPEADQRLLVTFGDRPALNEARERLDGLGVVSATLPEAGIWSLAPKSPATARIAAAKRPKVRRAEWSLRRQSAELKRVPAYTLPRSYSSLRDPFYTTSQQWGLISRAPWGAQIVARGERPRIAVLDSGVDGTHEEWVTPPNRKTKKGKAKSVSSPLVAGRATIGGGSRRWRDRSSVGHGTHVAGIAAAPANGIGIVGVAPASGGRAEVIPVRISGRAGRSTDEAMIRGIRWAVNNDAKVINISAGGPGFLAAFQDTVYWATERGAVIVASVGNEGSAGRGIVNYPAGYRRVIGVGAICDGNPRTPDCEDDSSGVAGFSNANRTVDLVAPGVNILSTVPKNVNLRRVAPGYALKDGTSMAAPFVAGAAALVFANHPKLTPHQVRRQLTNTATDIGRSNRDSESGYGIVNPQAAAAEAAPVDDPYEVNDTLSRAARIKVNPGRRASLNASIDAFDDPTDLYAVRLKRGDILRAELRHTRGWVQLRLWQPGVRRITRSRGAKNLLATAGSGRPAPKSTISLVRRAPKTGIYYVDVSARRGVDAYELTISRGAQENLF